LRDFTEIDQLERLIRKIEDVCRVETVATVALRDRSFPVYKFVFGTKDKRAPTLGLFGGVHGLEKIGTHVSLYYLESFANQLRWDSELQHRLERSRLVAIPLVNPGGMCIQWRSNPRGVDIMRNAPIEALEKPPFLLGGHRISSIFPWYRGKEGEPMEAETQALVKTVEEEMFESSFSCALDLHSGFGSVDQLWYPYAKTQQPFPRMKEVERFTEVLNDSFPFHIYKIERQAYTTHGDVWDYLFDRFEAIQAPKGNVFLPWTLEMGSWIWVKKKPLQLFTLLGPFNPLEPHRYRRIMRRHYGLIDFFFRSTSSNQIWRNKK
jgi:hypothetical protein